MALPVRSRPVALNLDPRKTSSSFGSARPTCTATTCGRPGITQWNSTLEFGLLGRPRFATKAEARREVTAFIDLPPHPAPLPVRDALSGRILLSQRDADGGRGGVKPFSTIVCGPAQTSWLNPDCRSMACSIN